MIGHITMDNDSRNISCVHGFVRLTVRQKKKTSPLLNSVCYKIVYLSYIDKKQISTFEMFY